jgi:hypothetical protein
MYRLRRQQQLIIFDKETRTENCIERRRKRHTKRSREGEQNILTVPFKELKDKGTVKV